MRGQKRALVELTGWLAQHVEKFFALCPAAHEFGGDQKGMRKPLETVDGRKLGPTFVADDYDLRLFPDVITTRPRALLPADADIEASELYFTFAIWTLRSPSDSISFDATTALESNVRRMWKEVLPDLHSLGSSQGVARKRLALVASEREQRIPGRSFLHVATVESATELEHAHDLVSVFVDLDSLERVAGLIEG